jgi:hypothetical protein
MYKPELKGIRMSGKQPRESDPVSRARGTDTESVINQGIDPAYSAFVASRGFSATCYRTPFVEPTLHI